MENQSPARPQVDGEENSKRTARPRPRPAGRRSREGPLPAGPQPDSDSPPAPRAAPRPRVGSPGATPTARRGASASAANQPGRSALLPFYFQPRTRRGANQPLAGACVGFTFTAWYDDDDVGTAVEWKPRSGAVAGGGRSEPGYIFLSRGQQWLSLSAQPLSLPGAAGRLCPGLDPAGSTPEELGSGRSPPRNLRRAREEYSSTSLSVDPVLVLAGRSPRVFHPVTKQSTDGDTVSAILLHIATTAHMARTRTERAVRA